MLRVAVVFRAAGLRAVVLRAVVLLAVVLLAALLMVPAYQSWRLARTAGDHVTGRA